MNDRTPASPAALLAGSQLMQQGTADVFRHRERSRLKKVLRAITVVFLLDAFLYNWYTTGHRIGLPSFGPEFIYFLPVIGIFVAIALHGADALHVRALAAPHRLPGAGGDRAHRDQRSGHPGRRGDQDARRLPRVRHLPRRARRDAAPRHPVRRATRNRQDLPGQGDGQAGGRAVHVHPRPVVRLHVAGDDGLADPVVLQEAPEGGAQGRGRDRLHRGDRCRGDVARRCVVGHGRAERPGAHHVSVPRLGRGEHGERAADPAPVVRHPAVAGPRARRS